MDTIAIEEEIGQVADVLWKHARNLANSAAKDVPEPKQPKGNKPEQRLERRRLWNEERAQVRAAMFEKAKADGFDRFNTLIKAMRAVGQ